MGSHELGDVASRRLRAGALTALPFILCHARERHPLRSGAQSDTLLHFVAPSVRPTCVRVERGYRAHRNGSKNKLQLGTTGHHQSGKVGNEHRLANVCLVAISPILVKVEERNRELFELNRLACGLADEAIHQHDHVRCSRIEARARHDAQLLAASKKVGEILAHASGVEVWCQVHLDHASIAKDAVDVIV